jgi:hypothetical protein
MPARNAGGFPTAAPTNTGRRGPVVWSHDPKVSKAGTGSSWCRKILIGLSQEPFVDITLF